MMRYLFASSSKKTINKYYTYFSSTKKFSKLFTKDHEWVSVDNGIATLGITDYAQSELGQIVHVDLPRQGERFKLGDTLGAVESVKTAADIYSPIEGVVHEVNVNLIKKPDLLNSQAESQGWYAKLKVDEEIIKKELQKLMNGEQYLKYIQDIRK